jgi:NAD(P)-dependent dehydrogenase (short-subunit alcohol dehydrogenase family)
MKKVAIFGANGDLGSAFVIALNQRGWIIHAYSRQGGEYIDEIKIRKLVEFKPTEFYDLYVFAIGQFTVKNFIEMSDVEIEQEFSVNLLVPALIAKSILENVSDTKTQRNFVFIGSTSAYQGYARTAPYSAAKFALRGLVESLNSEYLETSLRFMLASMGTMKSKMGEKLTTQDSSTFLEPIDVANRILDSATSDTTNFEPEIIIRRRIIR